ncbi:methyl-accepting chemotaxis protein [Arcobacter roscoffensis]|uniref:Methyl-accepting chemotaxis protein n=1 Tax=Arcobacter roscoffensis TaxID=2961520 RepID=A0ABY5E721_9BACT|nr:methyl-accepting chemotaxis protein [Arcobacter roscoffensis]UTJ06955.1 methyl-accepting chemotaxis protein [Arcobacter roscoffensis]
MLNNTINKKISTLIGITILILMTVFTVFMIKNINTKLIKDLEKNLQVQVGNYLQTTQIYNDTLEKNSLTLFNVFEKSFLNLRKKGERRVKINGVETLALFDGFARLNRNFDPVDRFEELTGAVSAVYVKDGDEYMRITSSLKDENGERILLDTIKKDSKTYKNINEKKKFIGLESFAGKTYMSVYSPIIKNDEIIGALFIGYDFTKGLATLKKELKKVLIGDSGYIYILDKKGNLILHKSLEGKNIFTLKDANGNEFIKNMINSKNGVLHYEYNENGSVNTKIAAFTTYDKWDWVIVAGSYEDEFLKISQEVQKIFIIATIILTLILSIMIFLLITKVISNPLEKFQDGLIDFFKYLNRTNKTAKKIDINTTDEIGKMANVINKNIEDIQIHLSQDHELIENVKTVVSKVSHGHLDNRIENTCDNPSLNELKDLINNMLDKLETFVGKDINELSRVLELYSKRDFTESLNTSHTGKIGKEIFNMNEIITEMLVDNQNDGLKLKNSSTQLSSNVNTLSTNATNQAASLEEVAASITQVTENINQTSNKAQNMFELSSTTKKSSSTGKNLANKTVHAMDEINEKVQTINESISVIDQIAFQTNILSLNAAVEAATAGEAGKGFAVVAQEVRNLASRSAEAANQIKQLVEDATIQAKEGKEISSNMINGFESLESKINETNHIITDVANAAQEQTKVMLHISDTINKLDRFTQENAQVAEEANSISKLTEDIASTVVENVNKSEFKGKK